jgi:hypothetical protein
LVKIKNQKDMRNFKFDEFALSKIIFEARRKIEVTDGESIFEVPLSVTSGKSARHFVALKEKGKELVVLKYSNVRRIWVDDDKILDCA